MLAFTVAISTGVVRNKRETTRQLPASVLSRPTDRRRLLVASSSVGRTPRTRYVASVGSVNYRIEILAEFAGFAGDPQHLNQVVGLNPAHEVAPRRFGAFDGFVAAHESAGDQRPHLLRSQQQAVEAEATVLRLPLNCVQTHRTPLSGMDFAQQRFAEIAKPMVPIARFVVLMLVQWRTLPIKHLAHWLSQRMPEGFSGIHKPSA